MDIFHANTVFTVYQNPINMHRSYDGLLTLAISELKINPMENNHILFVNRDRNQIKVLFSQSGQISIFSVRLSGSMKIDLTKITKIDCSTLGQLIRTVRSRKSRLPYVLEA